MALFMRHPVSIAAATLNEGRMLGSVPDTPSLNCRQFVLLGAIMRHLMCLLQKCHAVKTAFLGRLNLLDADLINEVFAF
jgi:hypothetical protein